MKNRVLDANEIFTGGEPKFATKIDRFQLIKSLNWYAQNRVSKDAQKYATEFFKKNHKIAISEEILKQKSSTFGFICRIVNNGATLDDDSAKTFSSMVDEVIQEQKNVKKAVVATKEKPVVSIQERLAEKISEIIGDLEGMLDDYIESKYKVDQSPMSILKDRAKAAHAKAVVQHFKNRREQFEEALTSKDEYIKEAWSNFKKTELKKVIALIDQIVFDASTLIGHAAKTKKPRKRKVKTADQIITKLKYCQQFKELKLVSIDPKSIIGASQLWVYNTKYRKIGVYHAIDANGFSVKGTSLTNFDEVRSVQKVVRKPADFIPEILKGGKVFLRTALDKLTTADTTLSGRINEEIILLRVIK